MSDKLKRFNDFCLINEVRYINSNNITNEEPLKDTDVIKVYHGFYSFEDVKNVMMNGLSGKVKAKRIYSYESGNNPYGLFVTIDFNMAKRFASSGVIIEFSTKVSDLESPVWVGGRSYFVQGEYTKSFKDLSEREKQRLINRQKSGESPYDFISKSDRPELAEVVFNNSERQALFIGDLNPNMIGKVWYNEILHKDKSTSGEWVRMNRKEFIKKLNIDTKRSVYNNYFKPNDEFNLEEYENYMKREFNYTKSDIEDYYSYIIYRINNDDELIQSGFYPKQINKIRELYNKGILDKYIKKSTTL